MSITYIAASAKPTLELGGKIWTSDPFDSVDGLAGAQGMNDGLNTGIGPWMNMTGSDSGINDADGEMIIGMILGGQSQTSDPERQTTEDRFWGF